MKNPKVSIVTCTYNGQRVIGSFLKHIFDQDYPLDKVELILADGGSTDDTLKIIEIYRKKYPKVIKLQHNKMKYSDGKGFGTDNASRTTKSEIIVLIDQDNILIQKAWLKNIVNILVYNKGVSAVQSRMAIPEDGTPVDKYLSAVGIEDPFAIAYSLNAQIVFNPNKFHYNKQGDFYTYKINLKNFYYAGGNGFAMRRKEFLAAGGYTQDIDNFYRMAKKNYTIAVPRKVKLHHQTSTSLSHFLQKRMFYVRHYLISNYEGREFYWFDLKRNNFKQNSRFILNVFSNLLIVPATIQSIRMYAKTKESFWLLHPFMQFSITLGYVYSFLYAKIFKKKGSANI